MLYTVSFVISGTIELEADSIGDALEDVADYGNSTLLDLASSVTVDITPVLTKAGTSA